MPSVFDLHHAGFREALDAANAAVLEVCQDDVRQFMNQEMLIKLSGTQSASSVTSQRLGYQAGRECVVELLQNALDNDYHLSWDFEFQQALQDVRAARGYELAA